MSNRQLEERQEQRRDAWVAKMLGVEVGELLHLDLSIDEITGNEGAFYGYRAIFGPGADEELVNSKFNGGRVHHLGFMPDDGDEDG